MVTTESVVRTATRQDEEALRQMRASVGWAIEFTARAFEEMAQGRRVVCVAEVDGRTVGSVQMVWASEDPVMADGHSVAHLSDLVVMAAYRRRGIGRQLAEFVENLARARGFTTMTLDVDDNQPQNQRLYERWGYVYFRQTLSPWGTWLNGMRKELGPAR